MVVGEFSWERSRWHQVAYQQSAEHLAALACLTNAWL